MLKLKNSRKAIKNPIATIILKYSLKYKIIKIKAS